MFDKSRWNFIIDAIMFLCMMAIAGLGFLMKFVLIPGEERWVKYGGNVELMFLNMDRHEWGRIHLILGLVLLTVLILHIILHWQVIINLNRRLIADQTARRVVTAIFLIASAIFLLMAFVVKPNVEELGQGEGRSHRFLHEDESSQLAPSSTESPDGMIEGEDATGVRSDNRGVEEGAPMYGEDSTPALNEAAADHSDSHAVRGYMTIGEVAEQYDVPLDRLVMHLGLPVSTSGQEQLGRLRREYGFTMSDVERTIQALKNAQ